MVDEEFIDGGIPRCILEWRQLRVQAIEEEIAREEHRVRESYRRRAAEAEFVEWALSPRTLFRPCTNDR